jgi:LysM repeat protein
VALWFQDVLGNASASAGGPGEGGPAVIDLPVGYTDPVIGVGTWPSTTSSYRVLPATSGATLRVELAMQAASYLAGGRQRGSEAAQSAKDQLPRFEALWYQLMQPDVTTRLLTTLEVAAGQPVALPAAGSLGSFAASACAWLGLTGSLADILADPSLTPTLADVSSRHGVGYDGLAAVNGEVALSELFPDPTAAGAGPAFSIPVYATFREGDSVAELCAGRAGVDPVEVLQDPENESLPLRDGIELRIPVRTWTMPADPAPPAAPLTLAAIADANRLTPASMVRANAATTGLLRPGFVFTCDGVEVVVTAEHPDVSLDEVAATFTDHGVPCDAVMAGVGNGEAPGMFRPLAVLSIDRYLIAQGDTLAANGSGATTAELASRNTATEDLYFAGTAVYLKSTSAGAAFQLTLAGAAGQLGLPADQLLRHNRAVPLRRGQDVPSALALPGQAALPATIRQLRMGWAIPAGSTLAGVAALFVNADPSQSSAALALAQANLAMPGVVAGGQTVQVAGQTVTTQAGDSFAAVLARFQPPVALAGLVAAVQDTPGILATGAILLTPPAQLPSTPAVWKPAEVAARYGVTVGDLAAANAALANLVVPGVTLTAPLGSDGSVTITTGAGDSFVSFSWRFAQVGQEVAPSAALEANADVPFLAGGAILLLAPPPAVLTATLGAQGWRFPAAVIQLQVWVEIARAPSLVDPEFRGEGDAGPAVRDRTLVPPMVRAGAGSTGDQVLALEPFAAELEAAIPALRVATGQPVTDGGIDRAAGQADVWAVAFGAGWLASVDVHPGVTVGSATIPQFFALRPLSPALVARAGVGIRPIQPDGTLGDPVATDFQGIDLEVWAGRVLSDIDLFLSARYAPAAYQTPARQVLEQVLDAKKALAAAIVQGLDYVLELGQEDPSRQNPPPPDWASAGEALRQRLLVSLSAGCAVDGVVQYQAQVQSPWSQEVARLSGAARVSPSSDTQGDEARRTSLGNAKTSLATTQAGAPGYVDFLLDVAQEGVGRTADLSLGYAVNELEFGIREVVEGYDASSWLAFVRPFGENLPPGVVFTLGEVSIPVPVRGYPALPALVSQVSQPTHQTPAGWQEAFHWDYACSYQHQSAAADQIAIEVDFNQTPLMAPAASAAPDTLFDALAQYQSMAAGVWLLLEQLATWDQASSAQQTAIVNAMQTFGQVVGAVAAGWSAHWTRGATARVRRASANGPQPERYSFMQTLDSAWDAALQKTCYTAIYLQRTEATGGLGWPQMGIAIDGAVVSLGQGTDTPRGRKYDLPAGVEAYVLRTFELRFTELHVASYQNGSARVQVVRNAQLSPLAPTRSSFVSRTPWSAFPDVVEPFLSYGEPFPIGTWTWTAADNPLGPVFDQMFAGSPANRTLSCQIRYGYELARSGEEAIVPFLPVAFRPKFSYVPGTSAGTLPEIIATVRAWNERERPATTGAEWSFALELYASVEGRLERPLLQLPVYAVAGGSGD